MSVSNDPARLIEQARHLFSEKFPDQTADLISYAPGRVEILGNHTDYNEGLVLGAAIDRYTVVVGRAIRKPAIRIYAESFGEFDEIDLTVSQIDPGPEGSWVRYVRGVIWALRLQIPQDCGFEAVITGNVPLGAGLSSSASLQVALALFLNRVCGVAIHGTEERLQLAQKLRKAENGFVGVASGLLDFVTVLFGRPGHAVFLDCRTLEVKVVGLGENPPAIVIMDTCTSRKLADGMYNIRRSECERVVDYFRKRKSIAEVRSLRDTTAEELSQNWKMIDPVGRLRARHVLLENQRVADGVQALESGELEKLGELVSRSHRSSMSDFQNSSNALDSLVTAALRSPGCLGAKLSGAGWAGCVVALVRPEKVSEFTENCKNLYEKETGGNCKIYVAYSTGPSA